MVISVINISWFEMEMIYALKLVLMVLDLKTYLNAISYHTLCFCNSTDGFDEGKNNSSNIADIYHGHNAKHQNEFKTEPVKTFSDEELCGLIDSILESLDVNKDGYITYAEYKQPYTYDDNGSLVQ